MNGHCPESGRLLRETEPGLRTALTYPIYLIANRWFNDKSRTVSCESTPMSYRILGEIPEHAVFIIGVGHFGVGR